MMIGRGSTFIWSTFIPEYRVGFIINFFIVMQQNDFESCFFRAKRKRLPLKMKLSTIPDTTFQEKTSFVIINTKANG